MPKLYGFFYCQKILASCCGIDKHQGRTIIIKM